MQSTGMRAWCALLHRPYGFPAECSKYRWRASTLHTFSRWAQLRSRLCPMCVNYVKQDRPCLDEHTF